MVGASNSLLAWTRRSRQRVHLAFFLVIFSIGLPALAESDASGAMPPLRPPQVLQGSITLDDAQNIALNQNRDVLEASIEMRRSESLLRALITTRYPKILAIAFTGQQLTSYEGHYVRNTVALPGVFEPVTQQYRLGLQVRQAQAQLQITRERYRRAKQEAVAEVKKHFLTIIALQSAIESLQANLNFLLELEKHVSSEVKRGSALPVDLMLVKARTAQADYELEKARDDLETLSQTLNRILGRSIKVPLHLTATSDKSELAPEPDPETIIQTAISSRPELRESRLTIRRAELEKKAQLSGYIPDISFGVTGIFSRNLDITFPKTLTDVGFLLVWEPWDWGRRLQLSKESNQKMRQEQIKLKDLADSVSIDADKARRAIKLAQKEGLAGELGESSTREALRVTHKRYVAGSALLKDLLEAQSACVKAIAQNVKAKIDLATARVELDEASGKDFN